MVIERIGALITENKKILLVTGYEESFYWTPGGKVHGTETHEQCLQRELKEELNVQLKKATFFMEKEKKLNRQGKEQKSFYYLVDIEGIPQPQEEITKAIWFSYEELQTIPLTEVFKTKAIPQLKKLNLL